MYEETRVKPNSGDVMSSIYKDNCTFIGCMCIMFVAWSSFWKKIHTLSSIFYNTQ